MPTTVLIAEVRPQKYGLVTVFNPDGSLNREYKITGADYAALALPGAGAPPGVTKEEWEGGRSVRLKDGTPARRPLALAAGKDYAVGDCAVQRDGTLRVKVMETILQGRVRELFLILKSSDYTGVPPAITVSPAVLARLDQAGKIAQIVSVVNGVVTWR